MIQTDSKNMKEQLDNKYILVDTCVIDLIFNEPDNFKILLDRFEKLECVLCINQFIYLEFIRICKNKTEKERVENFLKKKFAELPIDPEIDKNVKTIYPLYNYCNTIKNNKQVSVVDAINVAFLKKYGKTLYFITLDHADYPLEIMQRVYVGAIDFKNRIITWGIYKFDKQGFDKLVKYFEK